MPLLGASEVPKGLDFVPNVPGPNSRGRIGTSDNFYVLMTTGPEAVLLYCMVLHVIELYSIVLYAIHNGIAWYSIVLHGVVQFI